MRGRRRAGARRPFDGAGEGDDVQREREGASAGGRVDSGDGGHTSKVRTGGFEARADGVGEAVRWQIELVFKLWKQDRRLAQWRSAKPWAILCELYAKLIGLVLHHWLLVVGCWTRLERSLVKAARVIAPSVSLLIAACRGRLPLAVAVEAMAEEIAAACRVERRRRYPSTAQLLADPTLPLPFRPRYAKRRGRKRTTALRKIA